MNSQSSFLQSLGWALLNSLWQLALLWVVYQLLTALFKSTKSSTKSILAVSMLISGFAWFIFTFFTIYTNNSGYSDTFINKIKSEELNTRLQQIVPVASLLYLVLLIFPLFRFMRNYRYVQIIRKYGLFKISVEWRLFVKNVAGRMGIRKPVHIWVSEWVTSPVTIGYLKPVILIPLAAINHLSTEQMEAVLLHEVAHIKRYDYLLNLIINIVRTILYFNPFARAFVKIVETEREKNCDELVLQFQYNSYEYASALLTLEKTSHNYKLFMLGVAGYGKNLLHRIETIMGVPEKKKISLLKLSSVIAASFFILMAYTFLYQGKLLNGKFVSLCSSIAKVPFSADSTGLLTDYNVSETPVETYHNVAHNTPIEVKEIISVKNPVISPLTEIVTNPGFIKAGFETEQVASLGKEEEAIVKEAVESSKKVLESSQWKSIEKNLADVFNEKEKEQLKYALKAELGKFDWGLWENRLRLAYDKVDWDKVNNQLYEAINQIKTDSLVKVYSDAMVNLSLAQKELKDHISSKAVSELDINLKTLSDKQKQLQKELGRLKAIRSKKIVHL